MLLAVPKSVAGSSNISSVRRSRTSNTKQRGVSTPTFKKQLSGNSQTAKFSNPKATSSSKSSKGAAANTSSAKAENTRMRKRDTKQSEKAAAKVKSTAAAASLKSVATSSNQQRKTAVRLTTDYLMFSSTKNKN